MWCDVKVKVKRFQTIDNNGDNPGKIFHTYLNFEWIFDSFVITLSFLFGGGTNVYVPRLAL